jgi:hypothetical protein
MEPVYMSSILVAYMVISFGSQYMVKDIGGTRLSNDQET